MAANSVVDAHYAWCIVAMGTTVPLITSFVSQAFGVITLAHFFRSMIGALLSHRSGPHR